MNTRPTPDTDKNTYSRHQEKCPKDVVPALICRRIERERDEARERLTGIEIVMRAELGGHPDSELWGDAGLIAATMRCVDALGEVTEQRDEAREELSEWRILNGWGGTPEIIHDFIKGQQTRIHHAQDLEAELATVTEQRDEIDSMYHKIIKEVLECDPIPACKRENDHLEPPWEVFARIREQRDMLAKALEKVSRSWNYVEVAREALQSLTPND